MPASLNKVMLIGNLTRDPELRYLPSGQAVTTFTVAVNRAFTSQSGEKKEEASFIRIVTWARIAEICNEYLKKGSQVFVEGRLQTRNWEAQDGTRRSTIEVVAQNVQFLSRTGRSGGGSSGQQSAPEDDAAIFDESAASTPEGGEQPSKNQSKTEEDIPF